MTAFPSSSSDIVTTNLDSASDKPKDARQDLFNALTKLKTVVDSFDANSGICGLTSAGKVDSSKLAGQVVKASLGADCVDGTKIEDDSIDSEHIVDGSVDYQHISFGSTDTTMGGNSPSNTLVPTQGSVKGFVDTALNNIPSSIGGVASTTVRSATATSDIFINARVARSSEQNSSIAVGIKIGGVTISHAENYGKDVSAEASTIVKSGESWEVTGTTTSGDNTSTVFIRNI